MKAAISGLIFIRWFRDKIPFLLKEKSGEYIDIVRLAHKDQEVFGSIPLSHRTNDQNDGVYLCLFSSVVAHPSS